MLPTHAQALSVRLIPLEEKIGEPGPKLAGNDARPLSPDGARREDVAFNEHRSPHFARAENFAPTQNARTIAICLQRSKGIVARTSSVVRAIA